MSSSNNQWSSCISQSDRKSSEGQRTALTTLITCSEGEIKHISLSLSNSPRGRYLSCHLQQPQKAHMTHFHGSVGAQGENFVSAPQKAFQIHHMQETFIFEIFSVSFPLGRSEWKAQDTSHRKDWA